ncbi:MAG: ABC-F family ATP-binding cassette domain-containing protein, partial [Candidatus Omnitrophica bacterium]|nr:ABC-F family ATP-binding cassette domain-containing protein [Candidatus Omnitrophota bacterium]
MMAGAIRPDEGEVSITGKNTVGYLEQDVTLKPGRTVWEEALEGKDEILSLEREMRRYEEILSSLEADSSDLERRLNRYSQLQHEFEEKGGYKAESEAGAILSGLGFTKDRWEEPTENFSGGWQVRLHLAKLLLRMPDILLLDEPTNHLDLGAIEWLETYLNGYRGTLLCISHDRTFLGNITNQVFWLDRGTLKVSPQGFKYFEDWSEALLDQEARELQNRKQIVAQEVEWASRGVKARRKRNVRRLALVKEMRDKLKSDESSYRRATSKMSIEAPKTIENSSKIVAEFYNTCKAFEEDHKKITILDKFSFRIQRGDRIGILGKNGSGKTTFLKLLIGALEPDQGSVKVRKEMEFSYFDQKRSDLKPTDSLKKTLCPAGGDYIDVMGKHRHVCGYLKDFMFDPSRAEDKVMHLSGGQKNRLMLAKVLANPKTCLIL